MLRFPHPGCKLSFYSGCNAYIVKKLGLIGDSYRLPDLTIKKTITHDFEGVMMMSLEERIKRLEDMESIRQLIAVYAYNLDDGYNPEGVAALFTEDGAWIIEGSEIRGRDNISAQCRKLSRLASWTMHNLGTESIQVENGSGICKFYGQALQSMKDAYANEDSYVFLSVYEAQCVQENGKWLFSRMEAHTMQTAVWSLGWVKSPKFMGFFKFD